MSTPQVRESLNSNRLLIQRREHSIILVFLGDALAAFKCALQTANEVRRRPNVRLRMGIHSGAVEVPVDLTDERDCTGDGLTGAVLLMTVGAEGHILASPNVAEAAVEVPLWAPYVRDLGSVEVRPGKVVRLFNICAGSIGNPGNPLIRGNGLVQSETWKRPRRISAGKAVLILALSVIGGGAAAWLMIPDARSWAEGRYRAVFPTAAKTRSEISAKKAAKSVGEPRRSSGSRKSSRRATYSGGRVSRAQAEPRAKPSSPTSARENVHQEVTDIVEADEGHFTALIVNAKGLGVAKDQAVRIIAVDGAEIWSGTPESAGSPSAARRMDLAGDRPLVVRAIRVGVDRTELVLEDDAATRIRVATSENPFLDSNCVILVF